MRKFVLLLALVAVPAAAQNVDIEALSGLQFNFGNPGARSLGMGGAFLGLADDASAAEANPAGLTILRKPEISIEARNYLEAAALHHQRHVSRGRAHAVHASQRSRRRSPSPARLSDQEVHDRRVLPRAAEQRGRRRGRAVPFDEFTGDVDQPAAELLSAAPGRRQIRSAIRSASACEQRRVDTNNPFACLEYRIDPFISALVGAAADVRPRRRVAGPSEVLGRRHRAPSALPGVGGHVPLHPAVRSEQDLRAGHGADR